MFASYITINTSPVLDFKPVAGQKYKSSINYQENTKTS